MGVYLFGNSILNGSVSLKDMVYHGSVYFMGVYNIPMKYTLYISWERIFCGSVLYCNSRSG